MKEKNEQAFQEKATIDRERWMKERRTRKIIWNFISYSLSLCVMTLIFSIIWIQLNTEEQWGSKRFLKKDIQQKLALTIKHGGSLESVQHIYVARSYTTHAFVDLFKSNNEEYYYDPVSLSFILNDLLVTSYIDSTYQDSIYITNLKKIIVENNRKYPFDGLENTQKTLFENVVTKLGNSYEIIQSDITKMADELQHKNQLVSTYLNKSNTSFSVSIIALVITVLVAAVQIFQASKTNKFLKQLFPEDTGKVDNDATKK